MAPSINEFFRLDTLTGCHNFLSFVESLNLMAAQKEKSPFSILYTDLNFFYSVNDNKGHSYGDSVLRWLEIVLREESNSPTYRIGGDDFAAILTNGTHTEREESLQQVFARLNREGEQMDIPNPPATIALIHFNADHAFSINDVMFHLWETIYDVKKNLDRAINIYWAHELIKSTREAEENYGDNLKYSWDVLRFIANHAVAGIIGMGNALDTAQKNSYLDSISGLPNLRAALVKIEKAIQDAATDQTFSILLIDGDDLHKFNEVSYAAGDEAIQKKGMVLTENLRPGDFVARWRTGDEFIVILLNTEEEGAKVVAERFRLAIKEASSAWILPSSISIGVATYPKHGNNTNELVDAAESALKRAKDEGKDRVVLAE